VPWQEGAEAGAQGPDRPYRRLTSLEEGTFVNQNQLYGETESLDHGARSAAAVSDSIDGHLTALHPIVDAIRGGGWQGTSRTAFDSAYDTWEQGVVRLVASLRSLGDNTTFARGQYGDADESSNAQMSQVQGMGAFNGALNG